MHLRAPALRPPAHLQAFAPPPLARQLSAQRRTPRLAQRREQPRRRSLSRQQRLEHRIGGAAGSAGAAVAVAAAAADDCCHAAGSFQPAVGGTVRGILDPGGQGVLQHCGEGATGEGGAGREEDTWRGKGSGWEQFHNVQSAQRSTAPAAPLRT